MKHFYLSLLSLIIALPSLAQLSGNGYYRVQNFKTKRYISIVDNKSQGVTVTSTRYDVNALITVPGFNNVVSDPSTVMYIEEASEGYILRSQSTDSYVITNRYLTITPKGGGTYWASGVYAGQTIVLADEANADDEPFGYLQVNGEGAYRNWYILPVNQADNQYFGLPGEVKVGNVNYTSFYASFPFTFQSSGMKAFTVTKLDGDMAVYQELSGTVPSGTPVIVQCAGTAPTNNRLNLVTSALSAPSSNLLKGVYFDNHEPKLGEFHYNYVAYNANTMRVLGTTSKGKLGFVKYSGTILPRNRAYLVVPAGSPDEITLMTQTEYDEEKNKDDVTVTANSYSRAYGDANPTFGYTTTGKPLNGTPSLTCSATATSPIGSYPIVVNRGTVTNKNLTTVNGTLTVTAAPLTITAKSYTIKQNEPLPQFEVTYSGFKNGENNSVLTSQPTVTTNAPAAKTPGTYTITVSGASAGNYNISYVAGTLTITEADPITITAQNASMVYGDAVPQLTYTVTGGSLTGTPNLSCQASSTSDVGTYTITVEKGTVDYPNLKLVNGTLTVTPATITVKANDKTMQETDAIPSFDATFTGFKHGQTSAVLTKQPVFTCSVPADKTPGTYAIVPSGAEAKNYTFTYNNGTLTVTQAPTITVTANNATMVYGDAVPQLTYTVSGGALTGTPQLSCLASATSDVGSYAITVEKGTIDYPRLQLVGATLTVTQASVTVKANDKTISEIDEVPAFDATFNGFKNGQDATVLTKQPSFTCDVPVDKTPGSYAIVPSGAEAKNYTFTYANGTLTITDAPVITVTVNDTTMVYGDAVPQFTYTVSGGTLSGTGFVLSTVATSASDAGTYVISIEKGTVTYPHLQLVAGTLTIEKAPLTVSVGNYEREEGQENPVFELSYEGFRNGDESATAFIALPVATTEATIESPAGEYDIVVSGGEARNYELTYVNGKLTVTKVNAIADLMFERPVDVYTMTGRKVRSQVTTLQGLPHGIYIVNGRKVVVK